MRRIAPALIFFSVFFSSHILRAQNWEIYKSGDRFLYYLGGHGYDTSSIFIQADSTASNGNDSIFYMNRKVIKTPDNYFCFGNIPFPLQRKIIRYSNGSWQLSDTANWVLCPQDTLNSSWIFDSIHAINASVTRTYYTQVLGQNDSVKTISLSNGDSILVSKNHGILALPNTITLRTPYSLAGYNQSADDSVPGFQKIFDFHAGDIFEYTKNSFSYISSSSSSTLSYVRDSIMNVQSDSSGVTCTVYRRGYNSPQSTYQGIITKFYSASFYDFLNNNENHSISGSYYFTFGDDTTFQCKTKYYDLYVNGTNADSLSLTEYYSPDHHYSSTTFGEGFGILEKGSSSSGTFPTNYDFGSDSMLCGAIINNVVFGTVHPDSFFIAIVHPAPNGSGVFIPPFPNPALNSINVFATSPTYLAYVDVFDLSGRLIMNQEFVGSAVLDLEGLCSGVYIFRLSEGPNVKEFKVVHYNPKK